MSWVRNLVAYFRSRWHLAWHRVLTPRQRHVVRSTGMPGVFVSYECSCGWEC